MTDRIIRIKIDARSAEQSINRLDGGMRGLGGTADRLQTQLTRVASAVAAAFSTAQIVRYADEFINIQNRIRVVTSSTAELAQKTAELLVVANATRSSYEATAVLFSRLAQSTTELSISQERLLKLTETINKSFAVSGASAQEASNAIRQLSQGFASGALRGEEFNSVSEQAPEILRAVAKETGKTYGELREFAAQGGITSELLIRSIENYADVVERQYAKTNRTFEQSAVIARNNAIAYVGSSEAVIKATSAAGDAIIFLSNNLEAAAQSLLVVSAAIAGNYVVSLGSAVAANIASTKATINATIAERAQAQAAFFAANGIRVKDVALKQATASQIAYTAAIRTGTAAMTFLAGPAGVVLLAASAFLVFSSNAETARKATAELDSRIDKIVDSFKDLNKEGQALTFQKLANEQTSLSAALIKADNDLAAARQRVTEVARNSSGRLTAAANQARAEVLKAEQVVKNLNQRLDEVVTTQTKLFDLGMPDAESLSSAVKSVGDSAELTFEQIKKVSSELDSLFSGDINLFGGTDKKDEQAAEQAARINQRIEGMRLETQTLSSELALQQSARQGFLSQEQADLDLQTASKIQRAITERELLLAEKGITDEQVAMAEMAFQEQLTAITEQYADDRINVRRKEFSQQIGMYQNYANAALALGEAFGSKSEKANKRRRRVGVVVDTAAGIGRAFAENNFYTALGISALIAANGAAQLSAINSAGGGGGSISGAVGGVTAALPTQPSAQQQVGAIEITGLDELVGELRAQDGVVSTQFVANLLDKVQDANRLRGEG